MTTYDVEIGYGTQWVGIVPLGTFCFVHNVSNHTIQYRFGLGGTSAGIPIERGGYIKVEEVVYLRDSAQEFTNVVVIGD